MDAVRNHKLHAVLVPYPVQGQINPMMQLGKKLMEEHGFTVTMVTNLHQCNKIHRDQKTFLQDNPSFHVTWVENGLSPEAFDYNNVLSDPMTFHQANERMMQEPLKQFLISSANEDAEVCICVIVGTFCYAAQRTALELKLPVCLFWTQPAAVLSVYLHLPELISNGFFPYTGGNTLIDYIPGVPPIEPHSLPAAFHTDSPTSAYLQMLNVQFTSINAHDAILINTFQELEDETLIALSSCKRLDATSVLAIGPVVPSTFLSKQILNTRNIGNMDFTCLQWLDSKRERSVLYISFGTIFTPSRDDLKDIALGINKSKQPFLWVIREGTMNLSDILPKEVLEELKGNGLFVCWAPQLHVLSHPSVGGFLSHCGWNSTLESLSMGVPFITYPVEVDQITNSKFIVDVWKVGLTIATQPRKPRPKTIEDDLDGSNHKKFNPIEQRLVLCPDVVCKVVLAVLEGDEGKCIRHRIAKLSQIATNSTQATSSTHLHIQQFIQTIISKRSITK